MRDRRTIRAPEENLIPGLRVAVELALLLIILAAVLAPCSAVVFRVGRLAGQRQRRSFAVCLNKAPIDKDVAPCEPLLSAVVEAQRVEVAGILRDVLVASVCRLIIQLRLAFLLQIADLRQRDVDYVLLVISDTFSLL